jgi:hypothetical protein
MKIRGGRNLSLKPNFYIDFDSTKASFRFTGLFFISNKEAGINLNNETAKKEVVLLCNFPTIAAFVIT